MPQTTSNVPAGQREGANRRPLDGPVITDLAESSTPAIARMDACWAAQVVAGYAFDAADLLSLLRILGIVDVPAWWRSS